MIRTAIALRVGIAATLALTAGGCSAAPDADAIRQAVSNNARFMEAMEATFRLDEMFTGKSAPTFHDLTFERGDCVSASGASGYVCDFRIGRVQSCPEEGTDSFEDGVVSLEPSTCDTKPFFGNWTKARFFQANGAWQFEQAQ